MSEDDPIPEDQAGLVGCTCEHEDRDHDWMRCTIDGCDCEGAWEE